MPPGAGLLIALVMPLVWVVSLSITAQLAGWSHLARHYRASDRFHGRLHGFRSCRFGSCWNYNNCLEVGANAEGLYLAVFAAFRPGHPPLFIPWPEVTAGETRGWFSDWLELRFASAPPSGFVCRRRSGVRSRPTPTDRGRTGTRA